MNLCVQCNSGRNGLGGGGGFGFGWLLFSCLVGFGDFFVCSLCK